MLRLVHTRTQLIIDRCLRATKLDRCEGAAINPMSALKFELAQSSGIGAVAIG
ncbi:hypothetical protein QQ020_16545 [Fulvivirgaceae bacterium BMA12]|uniref:Uncharacterized protein n=1 Tax=Agaribacillus aureus TaxID=3051825 RepID=A0ABT8L7K2_9BACT|nr:hypothetical protein [Fulvivirgaceae bacterium BMA12]